TNRYKKKQKKKIGNGYVCAHHIHTRKKEKDKLVVDMSRYFLFKDHTKVPIKRDELGKNVMKENRSATNQVLETTKLHLKNAFGFDLVELPKKGNSSTFCSLCFGIACFFSVR